jgi:hypothetical protein
MKHIKFDKLLPLYGSWTPSEHGEAVQFDCQTDRSHDDSHGLALLGTTLDDGSIECQITLDDLTEKPGAMIVFRANGQERYYAGGLGGWDNAYTLMEGNNLRFTRIFGAGNSGNLKNGREYNVRIILEGQRVDLYVDNIKVISQRGLTITDGLSVGLFAFRSSVRATFRNFQVDDARPKAFIVMQFTSPYNEVYRDAIQPLVTEIGFDPLRVDDIASPGIIISDIKNQITESSIVIADITEANPNVYYEVGMAHAIDKPTVLLAQRGTKLPFDVGPHRCIFYENTIPGRARLQEALKRSLESLLGIRAHVDTGNGAHR